MKLLFVGFLSFSSAFYSSNVLLRKNSKSVFNKHLTNKNYYNNKYLHSNFNVKLHYYNKNDENDHNENEHYDREDKDIIEFLGGFMGYPSEQKWKGTRFLLYSLMAGYLLGDAVEKLNVFAANEWFI